MGIVFTRFAALAALFCGLCCHSRASMASATVPQDRERDSTAGPAALSHVQHVVAAMEHETSQTRRIQDAEGLATWAISSTPRQVSDADIDALARLMRDSDDSIRLWIADALGQLGPSASRAMPALVQALKERPCANAPATSAGAIRVAIQRMGGVPPNIPCTDPFGI